MEKTENKMETRRVPVSGLRDIMTVYGKDPAFHYVWVVDTVDNGGNILKYTRGGYHFALAKDHTVGEEAVYKSKQDGTIIKLSSGGGNFSYLMRIKKEWYDEDQKEKNRQLDETESMITGKRVAEEDDNGQYGSVKITRD